MAGIHFHIFTHWMWLDQLLRIEKSTQFTRHFSHKVTNLLLWEGFSFFGSPSCIRLYPVKQNASIWIYFQIYFLLTPKVCVTRMALISPCVMNASPSLLQVKRELAGVLIFESHTKAGTVCE